MQRSRFVTNQFRTPQRDGGFAGASTYLDFIQNKRGLSTGSAQGKSQLFLTADEKMKRIQDIVWQVADTEVPVLISGESGTGKNLIAKAIYDAKTKSEKGPMVTVNCSTIPEAMLEAELFGYTAGAFPGANQGKMGLIEQASGGTLVINNITDLNAELQIRFLRFLQDKKVQRLGSAESTPVMTRVIATTSKDIVGLVQKGSFKQDLYYRLYVIHIEVPSLRDRPKDIPILAEHFLEAYARTHGKQLSLSSGAMAILTDHNFPGNVRELENMLQRAVIMAEGNTLDASHLPIAAEEVKQDSAEWVRALPLGETLRKVETHFILETLKSHNGNRTHAAKTLGISLRTLRNKINEFTAEGYEVMAPQSGRNA